MHCGRRFERLSRYISRPPIARERLHELPDGRIAYRLRHPWRDGTTHVVFEPTELIEKLAVLIPWPRSNTLRYHGVFAPGSKWREAVTRDRSIPPTLPGPDSAGQSEGNGLFLRQRRPQRRREDSGLRSTDSGSRAPPDAPYFTPRFGKGAPNLS